MYSKRVVLVFWRHNPEYVEFGVNLEIKIRIFIEMIEYYRVVSGTNGIYEAVDKDCPFDDLRRAAKPDGSWLPKIGSKFGGAISLWTKDGMSKYVSSGLLQWHASVVRRSPTVLRATIEGPTLYADAYQVICNPTSVRIVSEEDWTNFIP